MVNQNHDSLAKFRTPLPDQKTFDLWHIESLIEELDDIASDLGMYKRMLTNPTLRTDNRALVENLQKLDTERYWKLEGEIDTLRAGFRAENAPF